MWRTLRERQDSAALPPARDRKKNREHFLNRNDIGPDAVKVRVEGRPGAQTASVLQGLTTKLAEARGGELNAATALRKLSLVLERTLVRAEADAANATAANEEQVNL